MMRNWLKQQTLKDLQQQYAWTQARMKSCVLFLRGISYLFYTTERDILQDCADEIENIMRNSLWENYRVEKNTLLNKQKEIPHAES